MATALWVRTIRHHRTELQTTVPCTRADARGALQEACRKLDLPDPLWLEKNEREWTEFGMTRFLPIRLSTEADNEKAQRLYHSLGFRLLEEKDGDDLVFELAPEDCL